MSRPQPGRAGNFMKTELSTPSSSGFVSGPARRLMDAPALPASPTITRARLPAGPIVTLHQGGSQQQYLGRIPTHPDSLSVFDDLPTAPGGIVAQMVFGSCVWHGAARTRMPGQNWPVLWVQGDVCPDPEMNGVSTFAVSQQPVRRVRLCRSPGSLTSRS